ncbi:MAG TPA: GAF and ANTAR domain-containing protein [Marmoricola sp.]
MDDGSTRLVEVSRRLAETLTPADLDSTLRNITKAAVALLPSAHYASITVNHADGSMDSHAVTDELLLDLDAKQVEWREGPCFDGASDQPHVVSPDLRRDERYPRYGAAAVAAGVRAQAGLRLYENVKSVGALNLYSRSVGAFGDVQTLGRLFADQAAVAISYATEVQNLHEALRTRTTIGQAVGIVMERFGLSDDRAFAFLTRLSNHRNVKLRLVAQEIVDSGAQQQSSEG